MAELRTTDGARLYYEVEGAKFGPPLVFSNSLGTNLHMWDGQVEEALGLGFRVIRYDQRGHGKSEAPNGSYTLARLADDVVDLLNALKIDKTAFCGLSMGGMTGIHLAKRHPPRFSRLALCNTAAWMPPPDLWNDRIKSVTDGGMEGVVETVIARWFTPMFPEKYPEKVNARPRHDPFYTAARICRLLRRAPRHGRARQTWADRGTCFGRDRRARSGDNTGARAIFVVRIPGVQKAVLDTAHLSNIERPEDFNRVVLGFLAASRHERRRRSARSPSAA